MLTPNPMPDWIFNLSIFSESSFFFELVDLTYIIKKEIFLTEYIL
jgi:hypothetical protein